MLQVTELLLSVGHHGSEFIHLKPTLTQTNPALFEEYRAWISHFDYDCDHKKQRQQHNQQQRRHHYVEHPLGVGTPAFFHTPIVTHAQAAQHIIGPRTGEPQVEEVGEDTDLNSLQLT